jgi:hypothetical protein
MDTLKDVLFWVAIGAATAPIWGAFLWELWEGGIRPRLVPPAEIDALSAAMLARHGDKAEEMAFIEEDRAWRYSDSFEQGKWRRVRERIEGMRRDFPPSSEFSLSGRSPEM